jgi:hypothetical protein
MLEKRFVGLPSIQDWDGREKERKRKAKRKNGVEDRRDEEW